MVWEVAIVWWSLSGEDEDDLVVVENYSRSKCRLGRELSSTEGPQASVVRSLASWSGVCVVRVARALCRTEGTWALG